MLGLDPATLIARIIVLLIAFTVHELAHAVTANFLGDLTPKRQGRLTLNPLKHLDLFGSIMLIISGFGWARPVMVNPYNMRGNPRTSMAIVAAAGPLSNLIMAGIAAIPFQMGVLQLTFSSSGVVPSLSFVLTQFIWINLILAFFNLIPVPPLDGYKILIGILPLEIGAQLRPLEQYGFLILIGLIFFLPMLGFDVLSWLVLTPASAAMGILVG
ncbi:MAG: site-2 protease family protein [Candidatus Promineifilaceae bacterium]|nr:site-2 protease family protein [Candidatus Promineifilaceae bacterium]